MADFDDTEHWEEDLGPSKSELKRQMIALQKLGERLVALPEKKLARIPLGDERLAKAIFEARRIRSKNALKRQHQFIGKLMRNIDPAAIEQALAELDQQHQHQVDAFHAIEQLRDQALPTPMPTDNNCASSYCNTPANNASKNHRPRRVNCFST